MTDLVVRLREQSELMQTEAWRRTDGGLDLCLSAKLADEAADEIEGQRKRAADLLNALRAAAGYLRNASIDLQTGAPKKTAQRTVDGGLKLVEAALGQYGDAIAKPEQGKP